MKISKFIIAMLIFSLGISCSKKKADVAFKNEKSIEAPYDTTAIDSFSTDAVSIDVARQIRMCSLKYVDSIKKAKDSLVLVKKIQDEERKKKEIEDKAKAEKEKTTTASTTNE